MRSLRTVHHQHRHSAVHSDTPRPTRRVALIGNPNCGKTTLFNALTGLRQKVGNYPGVTVEKKEGRITFSHHHGRHGGTHRFADCIILDLPGTYSLTPGAPDEEVTTSILLGKTEHTPAPDVAVCVVDANNLERSLYFVSQVIDRGIPLVVALNMVDVAEKNGMTISTHVLERELGVPVVRTVASRREGIDRLKIAIARTVSPSPNAHCWQMPEVVDRECRELMGLLHAHHGIDGPDAFDQAAALLSADDAATDRMERYDAAIRDHVRGDHHKLDFLGFNRHSVFVDSRYAWIRRICGDAVTQALGDTATLSDRIDRWVTHPIGGMMIFLVLMALLFQSVFSWAQYPMEWIERGFDVLGSGLATLIPPGALQDLVVRGALGGVAAVVTFLPQILLLFLFVGILEDSGYMARAAFVMDKAMSKVGLHGKSFIPLLSSFACAIPGIMASRTIEHPKDRLTTMLVAPLMSCSARLPVYTLLIAAFIPSSRMFLFVSPAGLTLFALYTLGLLAALAVAWLLKHSILKSPQPVFLMELPEYRVPSVRSVLLQVWERGFAFVYRAGTIILGASIIIWFLCSYPRTPSATPAERLERSFAGMTGKTIEPVIKPLGFDWKIGIGLVSSLFQREMFVSTMGTIYNVEDVDDQNGSVSLQQQIREDRDPATGKHTFTVLTAVCVMVYYVLAMQCLSTLAVMRRETNSWKWPLFQMAYMTVLAYGVTFVVYRLGLLIGMG